MRAYSGFVYSLAFRMLGKRADAEDVFQEIFLRAWSHHWIKRIATDLCIDRLKARASGNTLMNALQVEEIESWQEEEQYAEQGENEIVSQLLTLLPATHRAAVVLFYLEDRSVEEVARTLKQKPGTIKVWLFRAR